MCTRACASTWARRSSSSGPTSRWPSTATTSDPTCARCCARSSPAMLSFEEARDRILNAVPVLPPETAALANALGAVLADEVTATVDVPPFDNSAMDGFAVRSVDVPGTLDVVGDLPAGAAPDREVGPGQAIR